MKNVLFAIVLTAVIGCSNTNYYQVQFDDVDWLKVGDKVIIKGLEVGEVNDLTIDQEQKVLAKIGVKENIFIPKGSTFKIISSLLGGRYVEIDLANSTDKMIETEIQHGYLQPPDTTGFRTLTAAEKDSLMRANPMIKLADTVLQIMRRKKSGDSVQ